MRKREQPITTIGTITEALSEDHFRVALPNGKLVIGHLGKAFAATNVLIGVEDRVHLEMTPFDFSKARIVGKVTS